MRYHEPYGDMRDIPILMIEIITDVIYIYCSNIATFVEWIYGHMPK